MPSFVRVRTAVAEELERSASGLHVCRPIKFRIFAIDNSKTFGNFCNKGPDLGLHLFGTQGKIILFSEYVQQLMFKAPSTAFPAM